MRSAASMFIMLVVIVGFVALVYGFVGRGPAVDQPIAFNHAIHIDQAGLQCVDCHTGAETEVYAGLPGKQLCLDCHDIDEEEGSHPEKDKLFAFDDDPGDIPWKRVTMTAPDVYFSHRRHVAGALLDCLECHTDQASLSKPPSRARLVMTMNECLDCHEQREATADCLFCHR